MTERGKPGRPPSKPSLDRVLDAITRGAYDEDLLALLSAIKERQSALQDGVMERVKEVFGPEAEVVVGGPKPVPQATHRRNPNPFIEKDQRQEQEQTEAPAEDPLSHLDDVERQMSEQPTLDIERRGAMISGLHSSNIAE